MLYTLPFNTDHASNSVLCFLTSDIGILRGGAPFRPERSADVLSRIQSIKLNPRLSFARGRARLRDPAPADIVVSPIPGFCFLVECDGSKIPFKSRQARQLSRTYQPGRLSGPGGLSAPSKAALPLLAQRVAPKPQHVHSSQAPLHPAISPAGGW